MVKKSVFTAKIEVPNDMEVRVENNRVAVKKGNNELSKSFSYPGLVISFNEGIISINAPLKRIANTFKAHIRNMLDGVANGYTYRLKVCYSHYPIRLKLEGNELIIENFVGEKKPRRAKIAGSTKVKIEGNDITLTGLDIDEVSQTAGNIETTTRICGRDRRVFQDGIYIVSKGENQ